MPDSRTTWMREVPEDWRVTTIGSLYTLRNEKVSDKDYPPLSVTMKGIVPQLESAAKTEDGDNRKLVRIGDFAINSRSDRRGSCGISAYDGSVSLINTVLIPREKMHPGYYNWLFHSSAFSDEFYKWGHGIVDDLWTTRWQEMKRIVVPVPSMPEQEAIAAFLDEQCSLIDDAIAEAKASIEEYKAWKASMIYNAVTKGVDKDTVTKDSDSEWLGMISQNSSISRVARHFHIILGKMLCSSPNNDHYTLEPYYCAANVHFDGISATPLKTMWFSPEEKDTYLVKAGDLLVVEGGAGAGGCAIACSLPDRIYVQNSIMIVRSEKQNQVRYLRYLLEALVKRGYVDFVCNKATIPHFTKEKLGNMPFPLFSDEEAGAIADYLDDHVDQIDLLITEKQTLITNLEKYRKSLIFEVVTGKRKVVQ